MSGPSLGLIIGGVLPAILFGLANTLQKPGAQGGLGTGGYLLAIGAGVLTTGLVITFCSQDKTFPVRPAVIAWSIGVLWSLAMALIAVSLGRYGTPISKLVPLYNTNTLVAMALALAVFSEWKEVALGRLLLGAILIVMGGLLVSRS